MDPPSPIPLDYPSPPPEAPRPRATIAIFVGTASLLILAAAFAIAFVLPGWINLELPGIVIAILGVFSILLAFVNLTFTILSYIRERPRGRTHIALALFLLYILCLNLLSRLVKYR